jgi:hypothetical protein
MWIATQRYFECLTPEQLEFFAEHGYVEGTVTKPRHSKFDGLSRKALLTLWREDERRNIIFRGRSDDERLFYMENGYFPDEAPSDFCSR